MDAILILGSLVLAGFFVEYVWNGVVTDSILNLAQAEVDASRCCMLWDQIDREDVDLSLLGEMDNEVFDLPFIDLTVCPSHWWYEVWLWDFYARTLVMQHFAMKSTLLGEEAQYFYD